MQDYSGRRGQPRGGARSCHVARCVIVGGKRKKSSSVLAVSPTPSALELYRITVFTGISRSLLKAHCVKTHVLALDEIRTQSVDEKNSDPPCHVKQKWKECRSVLYMKCFFAFA